MPLLITDNGRGNRVSIPEAVRLQLQGSIVMEGDGNRVSFESGTTGHHLSIQLGHSCEVAIEPGCRLGILQVFAASSSLVRIGEQTAFNGQVRLLSHEPTSLTIGAGCLLAGGVIVTTSDMHSIIDCITGSRVNPARDVTLGNHVWIGHQALLLKGAKVGEGSIVGACALVSREIPANSLAVGVPARVIRKGVTWRHDLI